VSVPRWVAPVIGGSSLLAVLIALATVRRNGGSKGSGGFTSYLPTMITGGAWRPATTTTGSSRPTSAPRPGRVLLIGDSIGAHGGFVRLLGQRLSGHTFQNQAVVGYNTGRMLTVAEQYIRPGAYSEVIVEGDLNDGDHAASWTKSNLRRIYQLARDSWARVIAVASTPWKGYTRWNPAAQARQDEVRRWIASGADGLVNATVDAYRTLEDQSRPGYLNPRYEAADHLHLNAEGQRMLGEEILRQAYSS
jgi:lysophospholipase L1-like esterase